MQLENSTKQFLFEKFGCSFLKDENKHPLSFHQFYDVICKRKDAFVLINVKKSYDEYVLDILKAGNILFRPITIYRRPGKDRSKSGKLKLRLNTSNDTLEQIS